MPLRMLRAPRPWLTPSRPHGGPSRISRTRTPSNGPHSDPRRWALPSVSQHCLAMHGEPKWLRSTTRASHHIAMGPASRPCNNATPPGSEMGVVGCNPKPSLPRLRLSIVACHFDLALFLINPVSSPQWETIFSCRGLNPAMGLAAERQCVVDVCLS